MTATDAWAERVADLTAERDRARSIAVALEAQVARVAPLALPTREEGES